MSSGLVPILADGGIETYWDLIKNVVSVTMAVGGGTSYLVGKIKYRGFLKETDFRLDSDDTVIEISGQQAQTNLVVTVKRAFKMRARRKGRYRFVRELQGKTTTGRWDKATLYHRNQPVLLEKTNGDSELKSKKPLRFDRDDILNVEDLTSHEVIRRHRKFYFLVYGAAKGETRVKFIVQSSAKLNGQAKCYAFSEDLDRIEVDGHNGDYTIIPESNAGITYLVQW